MKRPQYNVEPMPNLTRQPGFANGFWVAIVLGLALLPLLFSAWPTEQARWIAAKAIEEDLSGDPDSALRSMEQAIQISPSDKFLALRYAEMLQEQGRADEAVGICQQLMEQASSADDASLEAPFHRRLYACRIFSELQIGNAAVALDLTKRLEGSSPNPYQTIEGLNLVAYVRALANTELDQAVWCVQQVLKEFQGPPDGQLSQPLELHFQGLTAAAMLAKRFDRQEVLLPILDDEIAAVEIEQNESLDLLLGRGYHELAKGVGDQPPELTDELELRIDEAVKRQNLACLRLTRGLLQDDLGRQNTSQADRRAARELGANEDAWLSKLPDDLTAFQIAINASALIDTEGCVRFRVAKNKQELNHALRLLNFAIVTDELCQLAWYSDLPDQMQLTADLRVLRREARKSLAVKLRHRQDILKSLKQFELAAADAARIRSLGFQQEQMLF